MNSKLFLSLPLVLLLAGCNVVKTSNQSDSSGESSSGSASSSQSESSSGSSGSSSESSSSSSSSSSSQSSGTTKTFDFTKTPFTGTGGIKVENKKAEFLEYLNTDGDYVTSITVDDCVYFQPIYNADGSQNGLTLCVGTASFGGSISFTFTESIKSISFTLQAYHKYYSSAFHADDSSALTVEGHSYTLDTSLTSGMPPMLEDTLQLSPTKKTITFSNDSDHQRSFVHNLTVEFVE